MPPKVKAKASPQLPIPADDSEAREAIHEIGDKNREALRLQAEMNDQIAALQERYGAQVAPINARIAELTEGLQMFCEVIRTIFETNLRTSYMAGRLKQMRAPAVVKMRPYWQYRHGENGTPLNPRPQHVSWDGLVLMHDDP